MRWTVGWTFALLCAVSAALPAAEPDRALRAKFEPAIARGRARLLEMPNAPGTGAGSLAGYALVKAGTDPNHPQIRQLVDANVARVNSGAYGSGREPSNHVYDACCDIVLLVEMDPVQYGSQIKVIFDYLVRKQQPNGSWYYPMAPAEAGDTSITQYALLGLWAAQRAGLEVPSSTWEKAARWLMATQRKDGSFIYHPHDLNDPANVPIPQTMTSAGLGSMLIIRRMLFDNRTVDENVPAVSPNKKKFGVLENLSLEQPGPKPDKPEVVTLRAGELDSAIKLSTKWLGDHYAPAQVLRFANYFHYTCERTGALLDSETFGNHPWYEEGGQLLVKSQAPTGEWIDGPSTSFALLFLSRATHTVIKPPPPKVKTIGGGLLAGGRGLPDDLSQVDVRDGAVKRRVPKTPIETLLSDLERPTVVVDEAAQVAVVEAVQLDQREQLVGQVERLRKLLKDARPEVRQLAVWALGRSDDLRQTPLLVGALNDENLDVAVEASLSLCVLTRQPSGLRAAGGKGDYLPTEPPEQRDGEELPDYLKRVQAWQKTQQQAWHEWYLQNRPYDERDDRNQIRKK